MSYRRVLPAAWIATTSGLVLERIRAQALRERLRALVRFLYHAALHAIPRTRHRPVVATGLDLVSRSLSSHGYDAASAAWATTVLEGRLQPPVSPEDPEAAHDLLRLRGVLPLLAAEYVRSHAESLRNRMLDLIRETNALVSARPAVGWDTTTAALRAVSLLQAAERLRPIGCDLLRTESWLPGFVAAHEPVLAAGHVVEAAGNHRLINTTGRCAVALLLDAKPLAPRLAAELLESYGGQFLHDGGHVERAPHYHLESMALADLIVQADQSRGGRLATQLAHVLSLARSALKQMIGPDGALLRLSDASRSFTGHSQTRSLEHLLGPHLSGNGVDRNTLDDFGLHTIRREAGRHELFLAVDCGPLGISSNPGHGHADAMSFSLYVDGRPFLVDPGTYLYADTAAAMWFKLPEAHNTIHWPLSPSYQLARFFRWVKYPSPPNVLASEGSMLSAEQNWRVGDRGYRHRRAWVMAGSGLTINDVVETDHVEPCVARLILHPEAHAQRRAGGRTILIEVAGTTLEIAPGDGMPSGDLVDCQYATEYGMTQPTRAVEWRLPAAAGCRGISVTCRVPE